MPKPPLPSSSVRDCLRIPAQFYLEWIFALLVGTALAVFLEEIMGKGAYVVLFALGLGSVIFCLRRMVRKVIDLRNAHGPMRGQGLGAFWLMMVLPGALMLAMLWRGLTGDTVYEVRQREAKAVLRELARLEAGFFKEFGTYTFSVKDMGTVPVGDKSIYMIGVPTTCAVKEGLIPERTQWPVSEWPLSEARRFEITAYFQDVRRPEDCKQPKEGFEIYAVGVVKEGAPLDVWRIDETGKLHNLQRGY